MGIASLNLEPATAFHDLAASTGIIEAGAVDLLRVATDQLVNAGQELAIKTRLAANQETGGHAMPCRILPSQ